MIVEWDPVEIDHLSGPNLRYNVSWTDPSTDAFTNYEIVSRPNLVISLSNKTSDEPSSKSLQVDGGSKNCYTIALAVQPINDVGAGIASTDTVVHVSREGRR